MSNIDSVVRLSENDEFFEALEQSMTVDASWHTGRHKYGYESPAYSILSDVLWGACIETDGASFFDLTDDHSGGNVAILRRRIAAAELICDFSMLLERFMEDWDEETGLPFCDQIKRYEATSVAKRMRSGNWIGWTHRHLGFVSGSTDWMLGAYELAVESEKKWVTLYSFAKTNKDASACNG